MRCDVFLTRIICVFLAFIYGSEIRLDETKGNDRAQLSSATQYTVQPSNERGRRKSTRDVFNAFYFEFSSCLFMLFAQSACVLVAFSMGTKESKTKRNETNEQSASKKKKKTHTHHQQQQQQHIARAINRIETSKIIRSASEFCLWEAKIESTRARLRMKRTHWAQARAQVKISNKTMPCHGYTMPKQLCQQIVFIIIN